MMPRLLITTGGPLEIADSDLAEGGDEGAPFALCCENLLHDTIYGAQPSGQGSESMSLQSLAKFKTSPLSIPQACALTESDIEKELRQCRQLPRMLVSLLPPKETRRTEKVLALRAAIERGKGRRECHMVVGSLPPGALLGNSSEEQAAAAITCDFNVGVKSAPGAETAYYCGVIGPVILARSGAEGSDPGADADNLHVQDERLIRACCSASVSLGGAPVIILWRGLHGRKMLDAVLRIVETFQGVKLCLFGLSAVPGHSATTTTTTIESVLRVDLNLLRTALRHPSGVFVGFTSCGYDETERNQEWPGKELVLRSPEDVARVISHLLVNIVEARHRIILSTGLMFRTQLVASGGAGITGLERVMAAIGSLGGDKPSYVHTDTSSANESPILTPEAMKRLLRFNSWDFLSFSWIRPLAVVEESRYVSCYICNKKVDIKSFHLEKFSFKYCGSSCLQEHRKKGFKQ
eukprot:GHVU01039196.1.p1 GENE.GHVU01039196.1~~GHVU01039196.1.p1  ORF type:complete len:465 (-),score=23.60 GHVU01039196.1:1494-2888(-)